MKPAHALPEPSQGEEHFRWRGGGVSRIEGLTDGVFALSLTLLIVSLQVPTSFDEMWAAFRQAPVFVLTFSTIGWLWYLHHQFHRRYGLEDQGTVVWNLVLLFLVLLYVYPLKFLATAVCQMFHLVPMRELRPDEVAEGLSVGQVQHLMLLYGAGFLAIFGVLERLYHRAWTLRDRLGLDAKELLLTRSTRTEMRICVGVGFVSMTLAAIDVRLSFLAGMVYMLNGPLHGLNGWRTRKRMNELAAREIPDRN